MTDIAKSTIPYKTKDITEAAFLWCQDGVRLVNVAAQVRGQGHNKPETFYFEFELEMTEEELRTLMFAYANQETRIEPLRFCQKQISVRDRLYAVKRKTPR